MSVPSARVHQHARLVAEGQLDHASGRLARLRSEERRAVEDLACALAVRIADALLQAAGDDPALAATLESIYGSTGFPLVKPAAPDGRAAQAGLAAPR